MIEEQNKPKLMKENEPKIEGKGGENKKKIKKVKKFKEIQELKAIKELKEKIKTLNREERKVINDIREKKEKEEMEEMEERYEKGMEVIERGIKQIEEGVKEIQDIKEGIKSITESIKEGIRMQQEKEKQYKCMLVGDIYINKGKSNKKPEDEGMATLDTEFSEYRAEYSQRRKIIFKFNTDTLGIGKIRKEMPGSIKNMIWADEKLKERVRDSKIWDIRYEYYDEEEGMHVYRFNGKFQEYDLEEAKKEVQRDNLNFLGLHPEIEEYANLHNIKIWKEVEKEEEEVEKAVEKDEKNKEVKDEINKELDIETVKKIIKVINRNKKIEVGEIMDRISINTITTGVLNKGVLSKDGGEILTTEKAISSTGSVYTDCLGAKYDIKY